MTTNKFKIGHLYKAKQDNELALLPACLCTKTSKGWIQVMNRYGLGTTAIMKANDVALVVDQHLTRTSAIALLGEQTVIVFWHSMEELLPI